MKKQALVAQRRIPYALALVLLLASVLAGCKPPAPETTPQGPEITVKPGETLTVRASAKQAKEYEWTLQEKDRQVSSFKGTAFLYTAPKEAGVALLSVTARNRWGASPETSLTIKVLPPSIPPGPIAIKPTQDTELEDKDCPIPGARGVLQAEGTISLSGLEPGQKYRLTLNGWRGVPPNDELCKINCTSHGEGYWDFTEVTADASGNVSQRRIEASLPSGIELYPNTTYEVKFFVKEGPPRFCTVLGHDEFWFTVEALQ